MQNFINLRLLLSFDIEKIISFFEKNENSYKFLKKYDENEYVQYPEVIKKYIDNGLIYGIRDISDLELIWSYLDKYIGL